MLMGCKLNARANRNAGHLRHFKPSFCAERSVVAAIDAAVDEDASHGFRDCARNDSLDSRLRGNDGLK